MVDKHDFDTTWDDFHAVAAYFRENFNVPIEMAIYDWEKAVRGCSRLWNVRESSRYVEGNHTDSRLEDVVEVSSRMGIKTNRKKLRDFAEEQKYRRTLEFKTRGQLNREDCPPDLHPPSHEAVHARAIRMAESTFEPRRIVPSVTPERVGWVGDASMFGIGVILKFGWARFKLKENWQLTGLRDDETRRDIAWSETAAIRIGLLMLEVSTATRGRNFVEVAV